MPTQPIIALLRPLSDLYLPNINAYASQEDYADRNGKSAPGFNPALPLKLREDPTVSVNGLTAITYNVVQLDVNGNPVVMPLVIANTEDARVNIPPPPQVSANIPPQDTPPTKRPVPIRALYGYEQLVRGPAGSILVQDNRAVELQAAFAASLGVKL